MQDNTFKQAFEVLQDREAFFENISEQKYTTRIISGQVILIAILCFSYGLVMGSYNSLQQALLTGIKIWMLLSLTLIICFPSFYIVQLILGSKIKVKQLLILLLSGLVVVSTVMVAFAPIVLFFQLSSSNYQFLQLLHVFVFMFSGFYGMKIVLEALNRVFESNQVYPKIGLTVFKIWVVIFAFVGMQLSWNLRPFIGSKDLPFELFRKETRGNFYTAVFGAMGQLLNVDGNDQRERPENSSQVDEGITKTPQEPAGKAEQPGQVNEVEPETTEPEENQENTEEESNNS